ncbi:hypothetical protein CLV24_13023 [Pontibacter ummariensis]|uniref:Uncharacterized protein n=2 Tax=Pontibacter ummariensis TaxID=1610492 RepID=A0A239KME9_9BACT|nr:hypothetical protein CLV24_13023 [Pontibacter ummariensis]SNT19577.1 hypothetical protein SAMN06296052_13023 [Pontibacter ummariensis]
MIVSRVYLRTKKLYNLADLKKWHFTTPLNRHDTHHLYLTFMSGKILHVKENETENFKEIKLLLETNFRSYSLA